MQTAMHAETEGELTFIMSAPEKSNPSTRSHTFGVAVVVVVVVVGSHALQSNGQ